MNSNNWDDLVIELERALETARRLRSYYNICEEEYNSSFTLPGDLSFPEMLNVIAERNGGKLIVKEAVTIICANLGEDRESVRNHIYANMYYLRKSGRYNKLGKGVYQQI